MKAIVKNSSGGTIACYSMTQLANELRNPEMWEPGDTIHIREGTCRGPMDQG